MITKWIMKFEVETQATLIIESNKLAIKDINDKYEVYFQNNINDNKIGTTILFVYIIFESENIETAEKAGETKLQEFLDIFSFSYSVFFEIKRRVALYDWTPGIKERKGRVYKSIPDPNSPLFTLNEEFVLTIEAILRSDKSDPIKRALRWFRLGLSSADPSEQFQLFWFVIETLIQLDSGKQKVPDKCCRCNEPLFCPQCNEISNHRPYPIQEIEKVFYKYLSDNPAKAFTISSKTRNTLLHGENMNNIEIEFGITLPEIVTIVGKVAWIALFNCIPKNQIQELNVYHRNNFSFYALDACANVSAVTSENIQLTIDDFPDIKIDIIAN